MDVVVSPCYKATHVLEWHIHAIKRNMMIIKLRKLSAWTHCYLSNSRWQGNPKIFTGRQVWWYLWIEDNIGNYHPPPTACSHVHSSCIQPRHCTSHRQRIVTMHRFNLTLSTTCTNLEYSQLDDEGIKTKEDEDESHGSAHNNNDHTSGSGFTTWLSRWCKWTYWMGITDSSG